MRRIFLPVSRTLRPLLALALFANSTARAQDRVQLTGESRAAAGRIADVRQLLDAKKWDAAVTALQGLVEANGDELAPLDPNRAVQVRLVCQCLAAAQPPEFLRAYRARTEGQAKKWLEQGLAEHDVRLLRKVVDEAFGSRAAERALDALGDLSFTRGRFDEAEQWWRMLTPLSPAAGARDLAYPDPEIDPARTRAKQLLARLFRGDPHWDGLLAAYRRLHPEAAGKLGGREGRYADLLRALADNWNAAEHLGEWDWSTFGGVPTRDTLVPATARQTDRLGALCRKPAWRFGLDTHARRDEPPLRLPRQGGGDRRAAQSLAFFPVFAGNRVLVADGRRVTAIDLASGRGEEWYDPEPGQPDPPLPAPAGLRCTLTAATDCVLARLGTPEVRDLRQAERDAAAESLIVCLDLKPGPDGRRVRWTVRAAAREAGVFEGTPLTRDGNVYVAATRCTDARTVTAVQCYALEARGTPPLRWSRDVCATSELQGGERRRRHHLLTLAGPNIVYCSHSGAIVAVDALSGRRAWAVRYPVLAPPVGPELPGIDRPPLRDLAPCLYAGGRLYAAPADSDRLLCLDPVTGRTLWERRVPDIVHLLGVGAGRLIVTTASRLRGLDAATGADSWMVPESGELLPMGRGLLLGDLVLWPTAGGVMLVRQENGSYREDPAFLEGVPLGNLAFARGCLVVAGQATISLFAPGAQQLEERRRDAEREPESAEALLDLGLAEADAGHVAAAVGILATAEALAGREPERRDEARAERHALLLAAALRRAADGEGAEAEKALGPALAAEFPPSLRVEARRRYAEQRANVADHAAAVAAWQALLEDDGLRWVRVQASGLPQSAQQLATERIDALLARHGPNVYRAVERRAQARLDVAPADTGRAEALERLTTEFPHATACRAALRELAEIYTAAGRHDAAAHALERLRARPGADEDVTKLSSRLTAAEAKLSGGPRPPAPLPLFRSWQLSLAAGEVLLSGVEGQQADDLIFSAQTRPAGEPGGWLRCRSEEDGRLLWQTAVPVVPDWLSVYQFAIIVGGREGAAAVRLDGRLLWSFPARAGRFRQAGGRLCLLEEDRLLVLDAASGRVRWQCLAPGAPFPVWPRDFHPNYYVDEERVLIQTASGRRWLLNAADGVRIDDAPTSAEPWPAAPRPLPHGRLLLVDVRRVSAVSTKTGKDVWTYTMNAPSAIATAVPEAVVRGETVLVLMRTNLGCRLQRLDAATGRPCWPAMPVLGPEPIEPSSWDVDSETAYLAQGHKLTALSLTGGKPRWERSLAGPARSWRIRNWEDYLLVYPSTVDEWRFQFRSGFGALQWGMGLFPEERPGAGCALLALDRATGRLVQRSTFAAGLLRLRAAADDEYSWPGLTVMRTAGDVGMRVLGTRRGLIVAVNGRVWRLDGREPRRKNAS